MSTIKLRAVQLDLAVPRRAGVVADGPRAALLGPRLHEDAGAGGARNQEDGDLDDR